MKAYRLALRLLVRDWRAGEMRVLAVALVIAVASMTSVGFFTDRVRTAMDEQAGELLGGVDGTRFVVFADANVDAGGLHAVKQSLRECRRVSQRI